MHVYVHACVCCVSVVGTVGVVVVVVVVGVNVVVAMVVVLLLPVLVFLTHFHTDECSHHVGTVLELAALLSLKMEDVDSFNRHVAQVKTYYFSEPKFQYAFCCGRVGVCLSAGVHVFLRGFSCLRCDLFPCLFCLLVVIRVVGCLSRCEGGRVYVCPRVCVRMCVLC
jgi:hypothetical protein